jgi:hypothetical protein
MITSREMARRASRRRVEVAACALLILAGCRVDPDRPDAAPARDGAPRDGGSAIDASGACPTGVPYAAQATSWTTGASFPDATLREVDFPDNAAPTGADGRGELCLLGLGGRVVHTAPDMIPYYAEVDPDVARDAAAAGGLFRAYLLSPFDADEVFIQHFGQPRDPAAAHVLVDVRAYPGGEPLEGARVELAGAVAAGLFTGSPGDVFNPGDTLDGGELIVFANIDPGPPQAEILVTPPASFDGACAIPPAVTIEAEVFTYVLVACTVAD